MQNKSKLQVYLTGLGTFTALASSSSAAIVSINVSSVSAPNAGLAAGAATSFLATWSADPDDSFLIQNLFLNNGGIETGLDGVGGSAIANTGGYASPRNFASGVVIDGAASFSEAYWETSFRDDFGGVTTAPAWGAGSYMGFRDGDGHFGWLEMTWNPGTQTFQILSGAFESVPGVGIAAGATVPEPSALGLLAAGGVLAARRRRRLAA